MCNREINGSCSFAHNTFKDALNLCSNPFREVNMTVRTRFAPSPTGALHIGSARTALFNWLFARHHGGEFLLRVEDTDRQRSTDAATDVIFTGMNWLGLNWDEEPTYQFQQSARHAAVAHEMLTAGSAYKCFSSQDEIEAFREAARSAGKSTLFRSPWRDRPAAEHPDAPFVIRLKAPIDGRTEIDDAVQGTVKWKNETLDDLVLLRSDGTPTYMLAVVVDDHDMAITHVIRGDDHLTNTARQSLIYDAMGWERPIFAHIPLIHGPDGKKLSKRHGATSVEEFIETGYPPYAMINYLARLGWSHGDDEFFSVEQAIEWFTLEGVGKSPAQLNFKKLGNLSGQHIRARDDDALFEEYKNFVASQQKSLPQDETTAMVRKAIPLVKERAKTYQDIETAVKFATTSRPIAFDEKAQQVVDSVSHGMLNRLTSRLQNATWTSDILHETVAVFAEEEDQKLGTVAQPLRAALTGTTQSPSVFEIMVLLGKEESLARIADITGE
jgi:glutamyl-tRNA synthetase